MVIEDATPEYDYICLEILDSPDWDNGAIGFMIRNISSLADETSIYEQLQEQMAPYQISFDSTEKDAIVDLFAKAKQKKQPFYETCIIRQGDNVIGISTSSKINNIPELTKDYLFDITIIIDKYVIYTYDD